MAITMKPVSVFQFFDESSDFQALEKIKSTILTYWKVYFDFAYYFGLSPYRFDWNDSTFQWEIKQNTMQKAISLAFLILESLYFCRMFVEREYPPSSDPTLYFYMVSTVSTVITLYSIRSAFWINSASFHNAFNNVQNSQSQMIRNMDGNTRQKTIISSTICIGIISYTVVMYMLQFEETGYQHYYKNLLGKVFSFAEYSGDISSVFICLLIVVDIHRQLCNTFRDLLFILTTLLFRDLVNEFLNHMKNPKLSQAKIMESYYSLKNQMGAVNLATGVNNFSFTLGSIPIYCDVLQSFISPVVPLTTLQSIRITTFILYLLSILVVGADAQQKIGEIYDWLYMKMNYVKIPHLELHAFLHDISLNNIGLSTWGLSVVSYNLLGTMLGLSVTYTIVLVQLDKKE